MKKYETAYRVVLTGGGTGGHVIPLLVIAAKIKERFPSAHLYYLGLATGPEAALAKAANLEFVAIPSAKFHRYWTLSNLFSPFKFLAGIVKSYDVLRIIRPSVIIGKGGYVALPVIIAGWLFGIPTVTHESDSHLGLANRLAGRFVRRLYTTFPKELYPSTFQPKIIYTGLPVNSALPSPSQTKLPIVLITGGSQGAHRLNQLVEPIVHALLEHAEVIHLTGKADLVHATALKRQLGTHATRYHPHAFLDHDKLIALLPSVRLAISRAGSTGVELLLAGVPTVFVPLPTAAADHQFKNATYWVRHHAAMMVDERLISAGILEKLVVKLLNNHAMLTELSKNAKQLMPKDAAATIVNDLFGPPTN